MKSGKTTKTEGFAAIFHTSYVFFQRAGKPTTAAAAPHRAQAASIQDAPAPTACPRSRIRPASFGQASRISGVSPADLTALMIWVERDKT